MQALFSGKFRHGDFQNQVLHRPPDQMKPRRRIVPHRPRLMQSWHFILDIVQHIEPPRPVHHLDDIIVRHPRRADFGIVEPVRHGQPLAPGNLRTLIARIERRRHRRIDILDQAKLHGPADQRRGHRFRHAPRNLFRLRPEPVAIGFSHQPAMMDNHHRPRLAHRACLLAGNRRVDHGRDSRRDGRVHLACLPARRRPGQPLRLRWQGHELLRRCQAAEKENKPDKAHPERYGIQEMVAHDNASPLTFDPA